MRIAIFCFLLVIGLLLIITTGSASTIAFIYSTDSSSANDYKSLLGSAGFATDLILGRNISTTDFSKYDLIIIGNDINTPSGSDISKISNSEKPIIGLGEGGYSFFGGLGLKTGYPNGWSGSENSIYIVDKTHTIFNKPNSITIPTNNILQLYSSTGHVGIYLPDVPSNVLVLGKESTDTTHYPFTLENSKYLLWGFTASSMDQTGKDLFINSVNYLVPQASTTATPQSIPQEGAIRVLTNWDIKNAAYNISGPAFYQGRGSDWNQSNALPGDYTITYEPVSGYLTPPSETQSLSAGGIITFIGEYIKKYRVEDSFDFEDGYIFLIKQINSDIGNVKIELLLDNRTIGNKTLEKNETYGFNKYNSPTYFGKKVVDINHDIIGDYVTLGNPEGGISPTPVPHSYLIIESVPQGADIFIDEVYAGKTNKRINIVDINEHLLRLEISGYEKTEITFKFDQFWTSQKIPIALNKNQPIPTLKGDVNVDGSITGINEISIAHYVAAEFSIGNYTVNNGEQITSQIELKDVVNFGTATISLMYDPSVVQVTTVSNGNIPAVTEKNNINSPANGSTRIIVSKNEVSGSNGNFIFSNIDLKAVGNGGSQSFLSIYIQEFADPDGHPINYTVHNGTFSIKSAGIRNVTVTPTVPSLTPAETERPSSETPTQTFPAPSPAVPGFLIIASILAILYIYLTLKK